MILYCSKSWETGFGSLSASGSSMWATWPKLSIELVVVIDCVNRLYLWVKCACTTSFIFGLSAHPPLSAPVFWLGNVLSPRCKNKPIKHVCFSGKSVCGLLGSSVSVIQTQHNIEDLHVEGKGVRWYGYFLFKCLLQWGLAASSGLNHIRPTFLMDHFSTICVFLIQIFVGFRSGRLNHFVPFAVHLAIQDMLLVYNLSL